MFGKNCESDKYLLKKAPFTNDSEITLIDKCLPLFIFLPTFTGFKFSIACNKEEFSTQCTGTNSTNFNFKIIQKQGSPKYWSLR